jgi:hypothetical protein
MSKSSPKHPVLKHLEHIFNEKYQVSPPYTILIFTFVYSRWEHKRFWTKWLKPFLIFYLLSIS